MFTDASVPSLTKTAAVALTVLSLDIDFSGRLNIPTSAPTGDLLAFQQAFRNLLLLKSTGSAAILTDSRESRQKLQHADAPEPFVPELPHVQ